MWKPKKLVLIPLFLLVLTFVLEAQNTRPKIGLVLSGGGAKGMAHIGVLKAMEEAGLTPDYITGTSMGSIIGGLYAIGYSADELDSIVSHANWDVILSNKVPLNNITFEEKQYYSRYLIDLYIKNREIEYPSGVIDGQALMALFSDVTRPAHNIRDFSKFPIPYACVAANIETGEPVVLNKGSLALSMRASMAIPSVFTPVIIDDKLLVDGGLVHNMPVQEAIDMGADIIIGVFVGTDLNPASELNSLVKILAQSAFITSARDTKTELAKCNILIRPDLDGYATSSFHDADSIVERGMKAGHEYVDIFRHLADSLKKLGPLNEVHKLQEVETYTFNSIEVQGNKEVTSGFITGRLGFKPGEEVTIDKLNERIDFIFGTQYFKKIHYEIIGNPDNQTLRIIVEERPNIHFRLSYHYDTDNNGGIIVNLTLRNILLNSSRLIFEADLSGQPSVTTDYFKYIGKKQNMAIGLHGLFDSKELPLYNDTGEKYALFQTKYTEGGLKFQSTRLRNSTFGMEINWSKMTMDSKLIQDSLIHSLNVDYQGFRYELFYLYNSLNQRYFPTKGLSAFVRFSTTLTGNGSIIINGYEASADQSDLYLQTSNINSFQVEFMPVIPLSEKTSLLAKTRLSLSSLDDGYLNLTEYDFIGGFTPGIVNSLEFYGLKTRELALANYFYARIGGQYEIKRNMYLQAHINYLSNKFLVGQLNPNVLVGSINGRTSTIGYGLMFGMYTPVGPAELMLAKDHYLKGIRVGLRIGFY